MNDHPPIVDLMTQLWQRAQDPETQLAYADLKDFVDLIGKVMAMTSGVVPGQDGTMHLLSLEGYQKLSEKPEMFVTVFDKAHDALWKLRSQFEIPAKREIREFKKDHA